MPTLWVLMILCSSPVMNQQNMFMIWLHFSTLIDLGIEVCFYNSMDDYAKMWLQLISMQIQPICKNWCGPSKPEWKSCEIKVGDQEMTTKMLKFTIKYFSQTILVGHASSL